MYFVLSRAEKVDAKLQEIMKHIFSLCVENGKSTDGNVNLVKGANVAGFKIVSNALLAQGLH